MNKSLAFVINALQTLAFPLVMKFFVLTLILLLL